MSGKPSFHNVVIPKSYLNAQDNVELDTLITVDRYLESVCEEEYPSGVYEYLSTNARGRIEQLIATAQNRRKLSVRLEAWRKLKGKGNA